MAHAGGRANLVFYAQAYHPIQAGSIDGTDVTPHDNGVYRALLASQTGLYDPTGDRKAIGDPHCTLFVGRLSRDTTEETLLQAMSKYGRVKNLRLVRHIVTGASQGYAFVEYETQRDFRHAYEEAHHATIDGNQVIVDYNRQQLMPGWIPRRLGGGLGGHKESGQLRFGGRERPFRAPLRPIPYEELKKLGIPLPPEGHYMSRYQIPPPPPPPPRKAEEREKGGDHRSVPRKAGSGDPGSSRKGREDHGIDRKTDGLAEMEGLDDTHLHESKHRRTHRKRSREERYDNQHFHRERRKHHHHSGSPTTHDHHRSRSPIRHGHSRSHSHSKSSRHGSRSPKYQDYHESSKDRY